MQSKENLVERINDGEEYIELELMTSRVQTVSRKEEMIQ